MVTNDLALTQYLPTLCPRTRRKNKYPLNLEIDDAHKSKVGDQVVNLLVSIKIGDVITEQLEPLNARTHVISSSLIKCCDEFATVDGGLENLENHRVEKQPNPVTPKSIDGLCTTNIYLKMCLNRILKGWWRYVVEKATLRKRFPCYWVRGDSPIVWL